MAVINELIESGLRLKRGDNLRGAIEHFRQLQATYPDNARIRYELANCWLAFGVPENALPHYRDLLALPKAQALPPRDMPRLYTQLGATLFQLDEIDEALDTIEAGLRLHPAYRPLRAWRIFALEAAGLPESAVLDALELMLEALAPSRWDVFEDDIKTVVLQMRARLHAETPAPPSPPADETPPAPVEPAPEPGVVASIALADSDAEADFEVSVTVREPAGKRRRKMPQLGKEAVRIDISGADKTAKDDSADAASAFKIPIDD